MTPGSPTWLFGKRKQLGLLTPFGHESHSQESRSRLCHWKIAVSGLCGYFLFVIFNPALFPFWGPIEAGQMGMSPSLARAIQAMAVSGVRTRVGAVLSAHCPPGISAARSDVLSGAPAICGGFGCWSLDSAAGGHFAQVQHIHFAQRLLGAGAIAGLMVYLITNVIMVCGAVLSAGATSRRSSLSIRWWAR